MAKISFTVGRVQGFNCPPDKQQSFIWDEVTEGLGLRATAGSKNYIFQGKLAGNTIRVTIGGPDRYSIEAARKEARKLKTMLDDGLDPRDIKADNIAATLAKREKERIEQTPALDAWDQYIKAKATKWSHRHKSDHESMSRTGGEKITRGKRAGFPDTKQEGILRPILALPLSQITQDRVKNWLLPEIDRRPTRARLALSFLSTFLTWCGDQPEYRQFVQVNACARMKQHLPKAKPKDDCLQREQLALWFEHVRNLPNPTLAAYLQCLLLTGARREEMASLQWEDIDFKWRSITIRDKVEGQRIIPLTPYVGSMLQELNRINNTPPNIRRLKRNVDERTGRWRPSPWVFSSQNASNGRLQEPRIGHNKALTAAGLPPLSIHGLRRSFGTLCEWVEVPVGVSAQIMGHKPSATAEKHYRRRPLDLLRKWHIKIEGWILDQAGVVQPKEPSERLRVANTISA